MLELCLQKMVVDFFDYQYPTNVAHWLLRPRISPLESAPPSPNPAKAARVAPMGIYQ